jgi:micrococcal nuclease
MQSAASIAVLAACVLDVASAQRSVPAPSHRDLIGAAFDARVVRVADGDTLDAIPTGAARAVRIRLHGVDAPELGEVFSGEALRFLRTLLFDQQVRVDGRDVDRYDRLVARVTLGSKDASVELLRAGLACHAFVRDTTLANEEALARQSGRGFWAATSKKPACALRQTSREAGPPDSARTPTTHPRIAAGYRGNVSSGVYHATWCPNFNCRNCTRVFTTEAEAKAAGFRPAADCAR